jgi:RNA polymerase sigma factor (sigma-70 family)
MNEDAKLLVQYLDHSSESDFNTLVQRHIALVYGAALRGVGGDVHLAHDVTQIVFSDLARKAPSLRDRPSLAGWLYIGTRHAAAAIVRREQRRKTRELRAHTMNTLLSPETPDPEWERIRPVLDAAMTELGETDREAVVLRYFQQRTLAEVGHALRVTEEAARKRVDRALDKLRDVLLKRGIVSTTAALGVALNAAPVPVPSSMAAAVAGQALQTAANAHPAFFASVFKALWPAVAVLAIGGWLVTREHSANVQRRDQIAELVAKQKSAAELRGQNETLVRQLTAVEPLRQMQAQLPSLRTTLAGMPPVAERHPATVTITPEGQIQWADQFVTLDRFLRELKALQASAPANESAIVIRAPGATFSAVAYAIDEARKVGIGHVIVQTDAPADPMVGFSWF